MHAVRVPNREAQRKIGELKRANLYDSTRQVVPEGDHILIPVKPGAADLPGFVEADLPSRNKVPGLAEAFGISAYDIIGEVAVIFIPDELKLRRGDIGRHLLKLHPNLQTIYMETGAAEGDFRVQPLEMIASRGPAISETIHTENGLRFKLDVTKVFFSPRQLTEREHLTKYVQPDDRVCVFFSGISPLPIYFRRLTGAGEIVGVELNPVAHRYGLENLRLNRAENIKLLPGDVRKVVPQLVRETGQFDLVVMPLPKGSLPFLELAGLALRPGGRVIAYVASMPEELEAKLAPFGEKGFHITETRKELQISPKEWRFVVHATKLPV
ncbi:MAG TPA: hypothetical protein ENN60_03130 [archaeon]|nr:hypothetical protein [archaeon]